MSESPLSRWVAELRRRRVTRVALIYMAVAWLILEVAATTFPILDLPEWTTRLVLVLLIAGFPIALIFSWIFDVTPTGVEKTGPDRDTDRTAAGAARGRMRSAWIVGVVVVVLGAGALAWSRLGQERAMRSATTVLVMPFEVRGGESIAYLSDGIVNLLSTKLDGAVGLQSVDPSAVLKALGDSRPAVTLETARALADRFGAGLIITGSIVQVGPSVSLQASLHDVTDQSSALITESVEGITEDIFRHVDVLAARLLAAQLRGSVMAQAAVVTTESLPALKAYLEGEAAFRRADWARAKMAFQQAVDLDSTFALAHLRLSQADGWVVPRNLVRPETDAAVRLAARLSPRHRMLLDARVAEMRDDPATESLLRSFVQRYPDDVDGWYLLGDYIFHAYHASGRSLVASREPLEQAWAVDPGNLTSVSHLIDVYLAQGRPDLIDRMFAQLGQDTLSMTGLIALRAWAAGPEHRDRSRAKLQAGPLTGLEVGRVLQFGPVELLPDLIRSITMPNDTAPAGIALPRIQAALGKLDAAEAVTQQTMDPLASVMLGVFYRVLPGVPETRGLSASAERLEAWRTGAGPTANPDPVVPPETEALMQSYLLGLAGIRMGDAQPAERLRRELMTQAGAPPVRELASSLVSHLLAAAALAAGNARATLDAIQQSRYESLSRAHFQHTPGSGRSEFFPPYFERLLRAAALSELGRHAEALDWYRTLTEYAGGPTTFALKPLAYLGAARAHEALNQVQNAADRYARFIAMWESADPELQPLVDDARQRLSRLADAAAR